MTRFISNPFYLDLRSLALSRICIGICLLCNLIICSNSLTAFYTDSGVMPRNILHLAYGGFRHLSLNVLSGSFSYQVLIFVLAFISTIALILGLYSRLAVFLSWFFFLSIYNRNPLVVDGGDDAIKLFLFWFCFLPTAKFFSFDNRNNLETRATTIKSISSFAFIVQLSCIYVFSALLKTSPHWHTDGTAIHLALAFDAFSSPLGAYLLNFPEFLKVSTILTWSIEKYFPFFLLIPFLTKYFRSIVTLSFISFHLGLAIFMEIGIFPFTMLSAWLAVIPSSFWDSKILKKAFIKLKNLKKRLPSITLDTRISTLPSLGSSMIAKTICLLLITYTVMWNVRSLNFNKFEPYFSRDLSWIGKSIRLDQYWALFAPQPAQDAGWFIISGRLKNLEPIDITTGKKVDFTRPKRTASTYTDFKWKKYLLNIWLKKNSKYRKYYADYICRTSNLDLRSVKITYMLEQVINPNSTKYNPQNLRGEPEAITLIEQLCPN